MMRLLFLVLVLSASGCAMFDDYPDDECQDEYYHRELRPREIDDSPSPRTEPGIYRDGK